MHTPNGIPRGQRRWLNRLGFESAAAGALAIGHWPLAIGIDIAGHWQYGVRSAECGRSAGCAQGAAVAVAVAVVAALIFDSPSPSSWPMAVGARSERGVLQWQQLRVALIPPAYEVMEMPHYLTPLAHELTTNEIVPKSKQTTGPQAATL